MLASCSALLLTILHRCPTWMSASSACGSAMAEANEGDLLEASDWPDTDEERIGGGSSTNYPPPPPIPSHLTDLLEAAIRDAAQRSVIGDGSQSDSAGFLEQMISAD